MTEYFKAIKEEPQVRPRLAKLSPDERMNVRSIRIATGKKVSRSNFVGVVYLLGDEKQAAEVFVEANRDDLEAVDFSGKNVISSNTDREIYDWILHALGEREIEKYETVVIERRPGEDVTWCIGRKAYEEHPVRRYSAGRGSAKLTDGSLADLYESIESPITEADLADDDTATGSIRQILDAFRVSDDFECEPTTVDEQLAIKKIK